MDSSVLPATPFLSLYRTLTLSPKPYLRKCKSLLPIPFHRVPSSSTAAEVARIRCFANPSPRRSKEEILLLLFSHDFRRSAKLPTFVPLPNPFASISTSSLCSSGPPNGGSGIGGGGGGGRDGSGGSWKKPRAAIAAGEEAEPLGPDVIILDVGGMSCGGCASSVKRILENEPHVYSASVNLATETAVVWAVPEAKNTENWKRNLGEKLAEFLTTSGFKSSLRDSSKGSLYNVFERKMTEKRRLLFESGRELSVSWALCAVCLMGHAVHLFGVNVPSFLHLFHSTGFHFAISLLTFIGPGRKLIFDGVKSLLKGSPNMNTLVGLGALSSFTVSAIAALIPKLGWKTFFEEPIMLLAFVLLGKNLELRAKLKATSDMTGLLSILPTKARLLVDKDSMNSSFVEVSCNTLAVGDHIVILPGDRVPADGVVKEGCSSIDESSFTGEPLPVTKLPGAEVTAGSINLNGKLTVEVKRPGGETVMADIVHLVEEAQTRAAPVQRLADKVAGNFTYGVIALSAVTFAFWSLFGSHILSPSIYQGSMTSLALQLSCSVLVVACPCALGLATPTAVLVGTSLGATKGLLLRGGNVLEKFSEVDSIVFDKTGTLTTGKPVVTKVRTSPFAEDNSSGNQGSHTWTKLDVLTFAAGVESNTSHPLGKAIVQAAQSANCVSLKVQSGTFQEEPGSGAVGIIDGKEVAVGTLEWVSRHGSVHNPFPDTESDFQSVVYVGVNGVLVGLLYIEDKLREDASHVVNTLSKHRMTTYMLSGDKRSTAEHVAAVVGIPMDKVFAGVKPHEKKKFIYELQNEKKVVAMVGDGINDAAALAASDVSIAMGEAVGAASDVSSVVLMHNKLSQLVDALDLSKETMKTVKQNLWWAFLYNIVGLPIAAGALLPITGTMLTPSIAGALMGLSSVGVMANSLLLKLKLEAAQKSNNLVERDEENKALFDAIEGANQDNEKACGAKWRST